MIESMMYWGLNVWTLCGPWLLSVLIVSIGVYVVDRIHFRSRFED